MNKIASAPCSYGVHGGQSIDMKPVELLEAMAAAGYTGSELGPPGFFGSPAETARLFADNGLTVVASYVPLHLSLSEEVLAADLAAMRQTLEELAASGNPDVVAVLADEGDDALRANPWRTGAGWNAATWGRAADRVAAACEVVRSYGVRPVFHPHYATYVEQAAEIDRLMELTDVSLCLDSGHFELGGASPAGYAEKYADRVHHVHVKDVRHSVVADAKARGDVDLESWWAGVACPLGRGDVALEPFLAQLKANGYAGWYVIEQDSAAVTAETWDAVIADQRHNLTWLAERL
ncbi:sugar phosphate isomerase/epimerase family protein [Nonomuraea africana]|uniref:Inosose dehydratase n=1 Tax=Nonomuraea africana TaxID=46171 RepID=A0ABR9KBZ9_9ACTN|nr:sugar phosphate isomerase/epimerase [Nonomuraea africana]MBE1559536.1 inosose dehydratase [Nonomuraea africana]